MTTITTFTGIEFAPLSPRLEDIDIRDIAHGLSNLCRFSGQCRKFYSVAEHSVFVSLLTPPKYALGALLHDASEAYGLNDVAGPIKPFFPEYVQAENKLQGLVYLKWMINGDEYMTAIKNADRIALLYEQEWLFRGVLPHPFLWGWHPEGAKKLFEERFKELTSASKSEESLHQERLAPVFYALA